MQTIIIDNYIVSFGQEKLSVIPIKSFDKDGVVVPPPRIITRGSRLADIFLLLDIGRGVINPTTLL